MIVYLYTTLGCHLCEQALALLHQARATSGDFSIEDFSIEDFSIEEIEIADVDSLLAKYGHRIPVLKTNQADLELAWPFDLSELKSYLSLQ